MRQVSFGDDQIGLWSFCLATVFVCERICSGIKSAHYAQSHKTNHCVIIIIIIIIIIKLVDLAPDKEPPPLNSN